MGNLFAKKPSKISKQDEAVLQLKQTRDKLKVYQKKIEAQIKNDRIIAKKLVESNQKEKALLLLRKKKVQESLIEKTQKQLENVNQLISDIEFSQVETQVVTALDEGNKALKTLHQFLSVENVEAILDETEQGIEYQREIDALISGKLTAADEHDIEKEFDELFSVSLPSVPTDNLESEDVIEKQVESRHVKQKQAVLAS